MVHFLLSQDVSSFPFLTPPLGKEEGSELCVVEMHVLCVVECKANQIEVRMSEKC